MSSELQEHHYEIRSIGQHSVPHDPRFLAQMPATDEGFTLIMPWVFEGQGHTRVAYRFGHVDGVYEQGIYRVQFHFGAVVQPRGLRRSESFTAELGDAVDRLFQRFCDTFDGGITAAFLYLSPPRHMLPSLWKDLRERARLPDLYRF